MFNLTQNIRRAIIEIILIIVKKTYIAEISKKK